jgi:hypothetical protein
VWATVKTRIANEQERAAKDTLAELYRERILQKQYGGDDLQGYFRDWRELEKSFFEKFSTNNFASSNSRGSTFCEKTMQNGLYELWSKFSLEKVMEGVTRISKSQESKRDL